MIAGGGAIEVPSAAGSPVPVPFAPGEDPQRLFSRASSNLRRWRANPVQFVREVCGAEPDSWQADALAAFPSVQRMAMKSCAGPGKSALLSWLSLNFAVTRLYPKIAATSITWQNLQSNLWAEMSKWIRRSPFLRSVLVWTNRKIFYRGAPEEWWIAARAWDRHSDPEKQGQTLAGLHANYVMAVCDESAGYPSAVMAAALGILSTGKEAKIVQAGNPTHLSGPLHEACVRSRDLWHVIEITGDPDDPSRAPRVEIDWAREMIRTYGRNSPVVRARVLGRFPIHATDAVIGLDQFEDAVGRTHDANGTELGKGLRVLGVDVARFGADQTTVAIRNGSLLEGFESWGGKDTVASSDRVHRIAVEHEAVEVRIDDTGIGGAVTDNLSNRKNRNYDVLPVNVGNPPTKKGPDGESMYANLKTQLAFTMRVDWFDEGRISLPATIRDDTTLEEEATDIRYGFTGNADRLLCVEKKNEFRRRHNGRSPDFWDALVLAFAADDCAGDPDDLGGWLA